MDFMKKAAFLITVLLSGLTTPTFAAQKVSAADWAQKLVQALNESKNVSLSTAAIEKQALDTCSDCDQKEALKKARTLFAKGNYDEAISSYSEIPRGHVYWLAAVEEKGWAQFRKDNFEKALAQSKTLLAPQFAEIANSEAFLLQSLAQLKICDYKGVFETHQIFKEKQKNRIMEVQKLAQTGWNDSLTQFLKKADKFPLTLDDMGSAVTQLPLLIFKDIEFQKQALRFKATERAIALLGTKNQKLNQTLEKMNTAAFRALKNRIQQLAQVETNENFKVIQKLNLVEVEAIQRIHTDLNLSEELYRKSQFRQVSDDQLIFMDDGKPWIDELDKFEVVAKTCAQGIRRKM